ncbi:cysteine desulfurase [Deltaproteobacteria bacterium Smac51]|nr:cysteine desulfurase [Deltaproteobacteria bacterium Smac51]
MIYLDNAATSFPKPECVRRAVIRAMDDFGNPSRSAHDFALTAGRCVEYTRMKLAGFFNCADSKRVVFTKNVTEALNVALASIDGHIITTEAEHNSVLRPVFLKDKVTVVPVDEKGCYTVDDIARAFREDTTAVVLGHASNLTGNVVPIYEIGRLCEEYGAYFIVDAAQTAGLININMRQCRIDALCFTGHKALYGLQGTGGMCLSERFHPKPLMVGGTGSRSFETVQPSELPDQLEAGTLNGHGLASLEAGLDYVREMGPDMLLTEAGVLARTFHEELAGESRLAFYGDFEADVRMPIVTLNIGDMDSNEAAAELSDRFKIAVRSGAHCAPLLHKRFGTENRGAVRFSFSHFNTFIDVEAAVAAVKSLLLG